MEDLKPQTHNSTVIMYQQNAKGTCCNHIDESAILYL